jgi:hypothetical protein
MNTMKRLSIAGVVALVAVVAVGASLVYAQSGTRWGQMAAMMRNWQAGTPAPCMMGGGGMMNGENTGGMMSGGAGMAGMMGGDPKAMEAVHAWMTQSGGMHSLVWNALAEALRLTPETLQAQLESGQTLAEIAEAQGVEMADLGAALEAAMQIGLEQAVVEGALTQAQADQMLARMAGRYAWMVEHMAGGDPGAMMSGGMMGGRGSGVCPHNITTAPGIDG